jgi:4-amino-4-deoxy-L-arabinose transferase-like glycosyltransferase
MTRRSVSSALWVVVIVAAFGAPLFTGLGRLDLENDEAIHTIVAESILDTGDWMTPHSFVPILSPDFVEKPPLKFWLVAAPIKAGLLPRNEFGFRFWDALFGASVFLYVFGIGRRTAGPWCGFAAAGLLFIYVPIVFQHGFRTNNMDAALVLSYCGGMYHFLRWARAAERRERVVQAALFGVFCYLGLMTKFVAVAFLPLVAGLVGLMAPDVRGRLVREWRSWVVVGAGVVVAASPWFVYQTLRMGRGFWQIILGDHVIKRFGAGEGLVASHVHPWSYYFVYLFDTLSGVHALWFVAAGLLLVLVRTIHEEWFEGALILFWFALPVSLISLGSSKLPHYLYAFVPALALTGGYAVAWAGRTVAAFFTRRPAFGRWAWAVQAAVALVLLAAGPAQAYRTMLPWLEADDHPMRSARECMTNVRTFLQRGGQAPNGLFVWLPPGTYQHPLYYYFGDLGWDMHAEWNDEALIATLDEPSEQRAVLMPSRDYDVFLKRTGRAATSVPHRRISNVILLLPGPFTGCGAR